MVILEQFKWTEVNGMKKLAIETGVKVDTAMYFARVITFDFANNGIGLSIFKQNQITNVAN